MAFAVNPTTNWFELSNGNDNFTIGQGGTPTNLVVSALEGDDNVTGTNKKDVILTFDGFDVVDAREGNDIIYTNQQDDFVEGGSGNDFIFGGKGSDILYGDDAAGVISGNDTIYGNIGNDFIYGGLGNDVLRGNRDNDWIEGGDGQDVVMGDFGKDTLTGYNFGSPNDGDVDYFILRSDSDDIPDEGITLFNAVANASDADEIRDFETFFDKIIVLDDNNKAINPTQVTFDTSQNITGGATLDTIISLTGKGILGVVVDRNIASSDFESNLTQANFLAENIFNSFTDWSGIGSSTTV